MNDALLREIAIEGIRTLFLIGGPCVVAVALVGIIVSALQGATTIIDPASAYAARVLALVVVIYLFSSSFQQLIVRLAALAFGVQP